MLNTCCICPHITCRGMPRVNAKAKDSEWVRQRKAWEVGKPADVNEVLLVSQGGQLLEGLTSNFFVLGPGWEVQTAEEGVLNGTVRELILEVRAVCCELLQVDTNVVDSCATCTQ